MTIDIMRNTDAMKYVQYQHERTKPPFTTVAPAHVASGQDPVTTESVPPMPAAWGLRFRTHLGAAFRRRVGSPE